MLYTVSTPKPHILSYPKPISHTQNPSLKRTNFRISAALSDTNGVKLEYTPWLIVGLGNPGNKYHGTRHNVGFEMIDRISQEEKIVMNTIQSKALVGIGSIGEVPVLLAKPQGYMNFSGESDSKVGSSGYHLASGDRGQGFDPYSLQGRRSFSTFGRTGSSLSTLGRGMAVYVSTSPIHRAMVLGPITRGRRYWVLPYLTPESWAPCCILSSAIASYPAGIPVYDEMSLPNGVLRLQPKGGHGYHNGVKSVIEHLDGRREFPRFCIGIGDPPGTMDMKAFLLQKFSEVERKQIEAALEQGVDAVRSLHNYAAQKKHFWQSLSTVEKKTLKPKPRVDERREFRVARIEESNDSKQNSHEALRLNHFPLELTST
ncbi:chloroplastic group IIB intron splicing facilitator CRS2-B, chloroplastic-like protein [Tanacetum coccineum]